MSELALILKPAKFRARYARQDYTVERPGARWFVHVSFVRHPADFDASVDIAVRLTPVEQLLAQVGMSTDESATTGADIGNILKRGSLRWNVASRGDCQAAAAKMAELVMATGVPWMARMESPYATFVELCETAEHGSMYSPILLYRCLALVAIAKRYDCGFDEEQMATTCRAWMRRSGSPQLGVFDNAVRKLRDIR